MSTPPLTQVPIARHIQPSSTAPSKSSSKKRQSSSMASMLPSFAMLSSATPNGATHAGDDAIMHAGTLTEPDDHLTLQQASLRKISRLGITGTQIASLNAIVYQIASQSDAMDPAALFAEITKDRSHGADVDTKGEWALVAIVWTQVLAIRDQPMMDTPSDPTPHYPTPPESDSPVYPGLPSPSVAAKAHIVATADEMLPTPSSASMVTAHTKSAQLGWWAELAGTAARTSSEVYDNAVEAASQLDSASTYAQQAARIAEDAVDAAKLSMDEAKSVAAEAAAACISHPEYQY